MRDNAYTGDELLKETALYVVWLFYFNPLAFLLSMAIWMLTLLAIVWQGWWLLSATALHAAIWFGSYRTVKSDLLVPVNGVEQIRLR